MEWFECTETYAVKLIPACHVNLLVARFGAPILKVPTEIMAPPGTLMNNVNRSLVNGIWFDGDVTYMKEAVSPNCHHCDLEK